MSYTPTRGPLKGMTYPNEYQYRKALALHEGYRSRNAKRRAPKPAPRLRDAARLSTRERRARERALEAVTLMRQDERLTIARAARQAGTTVEAMLRHAAPALEMRGGRYYARAYDRLAREMRFLTERGYIWLEVRDSRSRRLISQYENAVNHYINVKDMGPLRRFRGKSVVVDKRAYPFITDTDVLKMLKGPGELRSDSLYRQAA